MHYQSKIICSVDCKWQYLDLQYGNAVADTKDVLGHRMAKKELYGGVSTDSITEQNTVPTH